MGHEQGEDSGLSLHGIVKSFAGVRALDGAGFTLRPGQIHALLGANGAGKSTLMKIMSGAYTADEGVITIDGRPIVLKSPSDAKMAGIHCVYQEVDTSLVPHLTVAENIMLDKLASDRSSVWIRWRSLHEQASAVLEKIGLALSTHKLVRELTLAEKQLVLIARLLVEKAKFVILDEPTAPLSLEETRALFTIMKALKQDGIGIVFISHRLPEVFEICDEVTVMRDGRHVWTKPCSETSERDVVRAMLGRSLAEEYPKLEAHIGDVVLSVRGMTGGNRVRNVDLDVRAGEIAAVVGLVGAGKTELSRLLFGADPADRGTVTVGGRPADLSSPADAIRSGLALVPEERRKEGVLVYESVLHNLSLPSLRSFSRFGFLLSKEAERAHGSGRMSALGIRASGLGQLVAYLSGGNQQKVAIGKWTETNAQVFLFDEPTKGVDVGAKRDIFQLIGKLAQQGKAIVYFTCEFTEALGIADRLHVMCDGAIVKTFERGEATEEHLLYYASAGRGEMP